METQTNLSQPVIRILITIGILCTLFGFFIGDSAWFSLIILMGIALIGFLTGIIICDVNRHLHRQ